MFALLRRSPKVATPVTEKSAMCPTTKLPYGEPGSVERLTWIFAEQDLADIQERTEYFAERAAERPESGLIVSTIKTPIARPHIILIGDFESDGDRRGGTCVECGTHGELSALRDLARNDLGCEAAWF
ncbi:hypothetical protein OG592_43900 (plasmid) [Streptomyces avidinii]|uniref:hypothetical protein n=1 Tax=Streptomyces avidinii TaxID=1895 RepID=UPI00386E30EB|nr:hypothetical protein OG592_43900 [Streptomyces avidinii]